MDKLDWQPEEYSATGNVASRGSKKLLGKPTLDPLELMIREAVQNSCDAKILDDQQIEFNIYVNKFTKDQLSYLNSFIFRDSPNDLDFKNHLVEKNNYHIILEDKFTIGLNGPSRANEINSNDRNFVDFLRNIGSERDVEFGGGTYGYGKSSLYSVSHLSTIIVYSKTKNNGKIINRLMACGLGKTDNKFTGRHWWGKKADDNIVDPIEGELAITIAKKLGFSVSNDTPTGTKIMILCPIKGNLELEDQIRERNPMEMLTFMTSSLYWYLWPKMISFNDKKPAVNFNVFLNNEKLDLFPPEDHPKLFQFINAMIDYKQAVKDKKYRKSEKNWMIKDIRHKSLKKELGILALRGHRLETDTYPKKGETLQEKFSYQLHETIYQQSPFTNLHKNNHHIALMRNAELVIQYMEGQAPEANQYSGVFVTTKEKEIDEAFAESEPPAHDKWEPLGLEGVQRKLVEHALKTIKQDMKDFSGIDEVENNNKSFSPLTNLSNTLSRLLPLSDSIAPSNFTSNNQNTTSNKEGSKKNNPKIDILTNNLEINDNVKKLLVFFRPNLKNKSKIIVKSSIGVSIDDGNTTERVSPIKADIPKFLYWLDPKNNKINSINCEINKNNMGDWKAVFFIPEKMQVSVNIEILKSYA